MTFQIDILVRAYQLSYKGTSERRTVYLLQKSPESCWSVNRPFQLSEKKTKKNSLGTDHQKSYGGGGEFLSRRNFFSLSNSLYEFFLGRSMNFFSFNYALREYFFCTLPAPPPPISFLMVRPLCKCDRNTINDGDSQTSFLLIFFLREGGLLYTG